MGGDARKPASSWGWTRPGKLRLPDSTATGRMPRAETACVTAAGRAPELPMQVVQPYPTMPNPIASRSSSRPERRR